MAQKKKPAAKKKAVQKKAAPRKVTVVKPVAPKKPTYEQLLEARHEMYAANDNIKVAVRRLNREKAFQGDFVQRDHLVAEAVDNLALAREEASEAKLRFNKLSMEAKS